MSASVLLPAVTRARVEARIEPLHDLLQLLGVLDMHDGDHDLEDNADLEPSLGSLSVMLNSGEIVEDGEYDDVDNEISLLP